jgi:hypothetical protein
MGQVTITRRYYCWASHHMCLSRVRQMPRSSVISHFWSLRSCYDPLEQHLVVPSLPLTFDGDQGRWEGQRALCTWSHGSKPCPEVERVLVSYSRVSELGYHCVGTKTKSISATLVTDAMVRTDDTWTSTDAMI